MAFSFFGYDYFIRYVFYEVKFNSINVIIVFWYIARYAIIFFLLWTFLCQVRKDVEIEPIIQFGNQLRFIRLSKGLSMEKLAALSSFEYSQISRIELGQINTSLDTVFKLAKALKIPPKELFNF